jgi:2-polyprenyl-6-methoxyphenol hydroxylase-like FAD-dependent oxidoreductase
MRRTPRILVIGGGIGGLATAIALERQHAEVTVCEQSPKLSEIGAGIGLAPNAIKALRALGLEDKIYAAAHASEFAVIRSWRHGREISRSYQGDYSEKFGAPSVTIHRADLLGILADALRSSEIRLGLRCVAVAPSASGAVARFACVLAGSIARSADDLDAALAICEQSRKPRAREAVLGSRARARENHLTSPLARLRRDLQYAWRRRFSGDQTVFQAGRLYDYDAGRELT